MTLYETNVHSRSHPSPLGQPATAAAARPMGLAQCRYVTVTLGHAVPQAPRRAGLAMEAPGLGALARAEV